MDTLSLIRPDDWHLHLRDGLALSTLVPHSAHQFGRALIMPNLQPPITTVEQALQYRQRILAHIPEGKHFSPLMTLYLTDNTPVSEIVKAKQSTHVIACKLYPAGATTNSAAGVTKIDQLGAVFEAMSEEGIVLCLHGEVTDSHIDIFDREKIFIDNVLQPISQKFPKLRIVLEHVTTREAVQFVLNSGENVAATVTPQHVLLNRNAIFKGGLQAHHYCLPILKREIHRQAIVDAVCSGSPSFFLGTDSAPHARHAKEAACGCAGCYSAYYALELYAQVFEQMNALQHLEAFASLNGAAFYGFEPNKDKVVLRRSKFTVPKSFPYLENQELVPLYAGQELDWQFE